MKLHLPKMLTAALLAAATVITTSATAQAETYKGLEFSGDIFTIENTASQQFHLATFSNWYYTGTDWVKSSNTWSGTGNFYYEGETRKSLDGNNNSFWRRMFGDANGGDAALLGNTVRLTGASGTAYYEATFNPFRLGGVIAEAGDATYIVGRKSGECGITLNARTGASANMSIEANTILSVGTADNKNGNVFTVATGGTWTVATGKTLSVGQHDGSALGNAKAINFNSGANVTINGGGTVDLTHTNALTINSSLTIGESTTVNFAAISTLSNTINNAGAVTFAGTVTLSESLSGFDVSGTYVDYKGQTADNGYAGALDYTIIKGNAANLTQVVWKGATQALTNGVMHVAGDVDKTNYHLVTTDYTLDLAAEMEHNAQLSKVTMAAGTTLNYNANNYSGTIEAAATSTVNIAEGVTATATITAGVLQGKGTYALANGVSSLGNVTLGDNWTGAVRISTGLGTTLQKMEEVFSGLAREGYSSVEIKGVAGWFNGTGDLAHNLILTGAGEGGTGTALQVNNGSSGAVRGFTGTISGKGDFEHTWVTNGAQSYNFSGNIAGWEGAFKDTGTGAGDINVAFTGDAKVINADITHNRNCTTTVTFTNTNDVAMNGSISKGNSNVLNLVVDAPVTFSKTVSASKLTINAGKTATLKGAATIGGLDCLGTLVVDAGENTVAISGDSNTLAHAVTLTSGTLNLSGTYDVSALPVVGSETIEGGTGIAEGSGFVHYEGNVTVVDMTDSTGTLNIADGTVFSHTVGNLQVNQGTGIATVASTNYSALWVKSIGEVSYTAAQTIAGETPVSTVHLDVEEGVITMDKADAAVALVLSEGISGTVNATAATTIGSVTGLGEDNILTITGSAPVTFGAAVSGGEVLVDNGSLDLGNLHHTLDTLTVTNGQVTTSRHGSTGCITGDLCIDEGGIFTVAGEQDAFGYNDGKTTNIIMQGTDENHAVLQLNQSVDHSVTMSTDIQMNGYADITTTKTGFNTFGGSICVTGSDNTIDQIQLRENLSITVEDEGTLTLHKLALHSGAPVLTKDGAGTLVIDGDSNTIHTAIELEEGTLALDGTFAIGSIAGTENASYDGGAMTGNGFKTTSTTRTVVAKGDDATLRVGEDAHFMVDSEEVELMEDGTATTAASTDYTAFYVRHDMEQVSKAYEEHQPVTFHLSENTELEVDQDVTAAVHGAGNTSKVTISASRTLTGTAQDVTIAGSGTYALDGGTTSLGSGVELDGDWDGIVSVTGANFAGAFCTGLSNEDSWIELKGTQGYLTNQTIESNIILSRGEDDWAFKQNNGNDGHVIVFAGTLKGDGNLGRINGTGSTYTYEFTGDISDWTGQFISRNRVGHSTTFKLSGDHEGEAMEVGATLVNMDTDFRVAVDTDAIFNADVDATKVTVAEGKTATFTGAATVGTIAGLGKVVVDGDATLTVKDSVAEGVAIEARDGATIAGDGISAAEVGIASFATANFTEPVEFAGVKFTAAEEDTVKVINGGETTTTYTAGDRNMTVKADTLAAENFMEEATISNKVQVDNVTAADYSILTLDNVAEGSLELRNLTIGTFAFVQVYASGDHGSDNEATVVISDTLKAGGLMPTLRADLTMLGGSTLDLSLNGQEVVQALTLGSTLTFDTTDGLVNLGEDIIAYLSSMNVGDSVNLFTKEFETTLDYGGEYDGMYYDGLFVRTEALLGDFKVYADGNSFGLTKYHPTPEPTTGTLSLLALAALAARRRRK